MKKNILIIFLSFLVLFLISVLGFFYHNGNFSNMKYSHKMGDSIKESCDHMGNMASSHSCDEVSNKKEDFSFNSIISATKDLEKSTPTEIIELGNGDTYDIEIKKVVKTISGNDLVMLSYNGSIPGPTIKVKKGSEVTINLINKVADLSTTLHSHGLRIDNLMDGVPISMKGKQEEIAFGENFSYKLKFDDVGVFWYHPHVREDLQQELGLYGNYIVEPDDKNYRSDVNREEIMVLDDILIENSEISTFDDKYANYVLMGRYGNQMLINGDSNYNLNVNKGEIIRSYITNVSNTRVYNFQIPGVKMKLVGGDNGKYEKEEFIDSFIISPSERYIVELYFENSGDFEILNKNPVSSSLLGKINVSDNPVDISYKAEFDTLRENNLVESDIDNYRKYFDKEVDKRLILTMSHVGMKGGMSMGMMGDMDHMGVEKIEWEDSMKEMNKTSTSNMLEWKLIDEDSGKENMDIDWSFKVGDVVKVRIFNDPNSMHPMQHPIHFHGQRFLVVSRDGQKEENLVWKDTVLVETGEYIDILLDLSNPGDWMAHCHISEHLSSGMMMNYSVLE